MQSNPLEVQSLQRALDILEAIGNSMKPVPLRTITEITGLPKSTVYRLLSNLEQREYIRCNSDGYYQLGLKLLMMSNRAEQKFELKHLAHPYLIQLNEFTQETVHLGVLENNQVVYMDTVESPHSVRLVARVGDATSVHFTSLGKALLMEYSDEQIYQILDGQKLDKKTEYTITTPAAFIEEMHRVRELGYAMDEQESGHDCRCVGMPIRNHNGDIIGAISVSGPAPRFGLDFVHKQVVERLRIATSQISKALGYNE